VADWRTTGAPAWRDFGPRRSKSRRARQTLSQEIGIEPGPELRRLQGQILSQDPPSLRRSDPRSRHFELEGGAPPLAGGERELRWPRERMEEAGSGRPRLALVSGADACLRHWPDSPSSVRSECPEQEYVSACPWAHELHPDARLDPA
jgi:Bacterial transcriptional activator domain